MSLHTVYIANYYYSRDSSKWLGTVEIRLGEDSTAYSNSNSIVWTELFDGGFFPIGTSFNGRYLTLRRKHLNEDFGNRN